MGLFNTADAFRLSAEALEAKKVDSGHAVKPILLCYFHALELFLKALLRQKHSVETLSSKKFGHNIERLVKEAETLGLAIPEEDREVFAKVDTKAMLEARYIETGAKNWPKLEELRHTCKRVRDGVGDLLIKEGLPVRL
jgi:HEPN domain-containing protein